MYQNFYLRSHIDTKYRYFLCSLFLEGNDEMLRKERRRTGNMRRLQNALYNVGTNGLAHTIF